MEYASLGTVSSGTLRTADLLDSFASELEYHVQRNANEWCSDSGRIERDRYLRLVGDAREIDADDDDTDDAGSEIVNELFDALNEFAPPYCYFGAIAGDGADFGFWFFGEDCISDLLHVSDPSEVENHLGEECVFVNDHGNVTIYGADGKPVLEIV